MAERENATVFRKKNPDHSSFTELIPALMKSK